MITISAIKADPELVVLKFGDDEYEITLTEIAVRELANQLVDFLNPEHVIASWMFDVGDN